MVEDDKELEAKDNKYEEDEDDKVPEIEDDEDEEDKDDDTSEAEGVVLVSTRCLGKAQDRRELPVIHKRED
jgi:hypothetical protein